jgi:hypothetical protein
MRRLGNTVRFGFLLSLTVAVGGLVTATPTAAQTEPPNTPVVVIPGGPPFVLAGPYSGSESASAGDFPCPPTSAPIREDFSGLFTHPSLGAGAYEFHVRVCVPTEATSKGAILPGTFMLNGNKQFLSGTLSFKGFEPVPGGFGYQFELTASGGCNAHFRADGQVAGAPGFGDSGTLTQIGAIICRVSG